MADMTQWIDRRCKSVDVAKGIGILLVFLGHSLYYGSYPFRCIFYFHMPLFFVLSGCFENRGMAGCADWRKVVRRLLVPIVFYSVVAFVLWLVVGRGDVGSGFGAYSGGISHGDCGELFLSLYRGQPFYLGSMWFLFCLLGVKLYFCGMSEIVRKIPIRRQFYAWMVILVLSAVIGKGCRVLGHENFPFKLLSVPMAAAYYIAGYLCSKWIRDDRAKPGLFMLASAAAFVVVLAVAHYSDRCPNMCAVRYPKTFCWFLASASGVFGTIMAAKCFRFGWLAWIGRNSLHFFLLEMMSVFVVVALLRSCGVDIPYALFAEDGFPRYWILVTFPVSLLLTAALLPAVRRIYGKLADWMSRGDAR